MIPIILAFFNIIVRNMFFLLYAYYRIIKAIIRCCI